MRTSVALAVAVLITSVAVGCGGKKDLHRLGPDVLNLVPQEERAALDPYLAAFEQAKKDAEEAKDALSQTKTDVGKATTEAKRAELLSDEFTAKASHLKARQARQEAELKAEGS